MDRISGEFQSSLFGSEEIQALKQRVSSCGNMFQTMVIFDWELTVILSSSMYGSTDKVNVYMVISYINLHVIVVVPAGAKGKGEALKVLHQLQGCRALNT